MTGWLAASYVWRKQLPDLADELRKLRGEPMRRQTPEQMGHMLRALGMKPMRAQA